MKKPFLVLAFLTMMVPGWASAGISVCFDHALLTKDLTQAINAQYVPSLPAELVKSIGGVGGKDPSASVSPFALSVITTSGGIRRLRIFVSEFKYSSRFGDTPIFAGVRVGLRGSIQIDSSLGLTSDGKKFRLIQNQVKLDTRVDMGGTFGHFFGQLLTAVVNAFGLQGKMSRQIQSQMDRVEIAPSLFESTVEKDGKKTSLKLKVKTVELGVSQFCAKAELE